MVLNEGDFFLSGTPAIGRLNDNDSLNARLSYEGKLLDEFSFKVKYW